MIATFEMWLQRKSRADGAGRDHRGECGMTTYEAIASAPAGAEPVQTARPPAAWHMIGVCFSGYALNSMDLLIIVIAMQRSGEVRATDAQVVLGATAVLFSSALGGWVAGAVSDRFSRVLALKWTIAGLALSTALCGFAGNYFFLFCFHLLVGIGFGAQWAAAAVMVGEVAPPAHRGWWGGFMQSGWAVGWGLALFGVPALVNFLWQYLPLSLSQHIPVWRAYIWAGALPALPILWAIHLFIKAESPVFADAQKKLAIAGKTADFLEIFSPTWLWTTVRSCMLSVGAMGGYYAIVVWLPAFLTDRKFMGSNSVAYPVMLIAGSFIGYLASGWLSDLAAVGRRRNFVLFSIGAIFTVFAHLYVTNTAVILLLAFPLGFFASGALAIMGACLTELFPTRMGGSGVGFTYNFGRGFAGLILWLVGGAGLPQGQVGGAGSAGLSQMLLIALFVLIAYSLVIIWARLLPETRGWKLDTSADDPPGVRP
jgi:MFS family permease